MTYPSPRYIPPPDLLVPAAHAALTAALLAYALCTRRRLARARGELALCLRHGLDLGHQLRERTRPEEGPAR